MKKFLSLLMICAGVSVSSLAYANDLANDTSDPLFLQGQEEIFTQSSITYWGHILRAGQSISYGMNERLAIGVDVHYQQDFNGKEDGFSAVDLGGVYRLANAGDNSANIISDVLFGFKFGGSSQVRTPDYADSTYYAGLRFGRQWAGLTLAATVKSTWVFDDTRGVAFLDFSPEAYFRTAPDWRIGTGLTIRKATHKDPIDDTDFDQEWLHFKVVRQYGRTQYIGHADFEFESDDIQVGFQINILF